MAASPPAALTSQEEGSSDSSEGDLTPEDKLPPAKDLVLETSDGVRIVCTYYPGDGARGRDAVPVIMIPGEKGSRHDFQSLAIFLQRRHHALIAMDLRGHGDSTKTNNPNIKLDAEKMPNLHYELMSAVRISDFGVKGDVEQVKNFLLKEHDAQRLNIEKLCLIGADMGCIVAVNWATWDWEIPSSATIKQSQRVKAIVLLSPKERHKSLKIAYTFKSEAIRKWISFYIAVGAGDEARLKEAEKIDKALHRDRRNPDKPEDRTLFFNRKLQTRLQGTQLLGENLHVEEQIAEFIDLRVEQLHIAWTERKKRLPAP
ncbi:MAG TPA: alpha/beta fold hydrolase [Pirellulales bacterium]|nr:alpha/beta fold hydrolase [Pirellulales bacterium]